MRLSTWNFIGAGCLFAGALLALLQGRPDFFFGLVGGGLFGISCGGRQLEDERKEPKP